jgi:hypothetical protein
LSVRNGQEEGIAVFDPPVDTVSGLYDRGVSKSLVVCLVHVKWCEVK